MPTTISGSTGVSQVQDGVIGTAKLENGAVTPIKTQVSATPSMVRLQSVNGYGSTNTAIRRFSTVTANQGSDITYADSATLGASFTINTSGVYSMAYSDAFSNSSVLGFSRNSNQLTTSLATITAAHRLMAAESYNINQLVSVAVCVALTAGDVIRPHAEAVASGATVTHTGFVITRVA